MIRSARLEGVHLYPYLYLPKGAASTRDDANGYNPHETLMIDSAHSRTRTWDPLINSQML